MYVICWQTGLGGMQKAQNPGMDRQPVLKGSASVGMLEMNVCICLLLTIKLNQPVSSSQVQRGKRAQDPAMDSRADGQRAHTDIQEICQCACVLVDLQSEDTCFH